MEEALAKKNMEDITAIAHKLLPLFTMLGATRCIPALTWMEQRRGTTEIGEEAIEKTNFIIEEIEKVIDEAKSRSKYRMKHEELSPVKLKGIRNRVRVSVHREKAYFCTNKTT